MTLESFWFEALLILALILANGFFAASEIAMIAMRKSRIDSLVERGVTALLAQTAGAPPHRAILGCTHYPLVEHLFRRHLPPFTRLLSQPQVVADSLEDYLTRHPHYIDGPAASPVLLTTGDPASVGATARIFWPDAPSFGHLPL